MFTHKHPDQLTYEEKNAIRYVGGYVCAKLRNKFPLTRHLISSYVQDGDESNEWIVTIDRGEASSHQRIHLYTFRSNGKGCSANI